MTAREIIAAWDERDRRYSVDPRAAARAREMEDGIRVNRYAEARLLPPQEQKRALDVLAAWGPPTTV